MTIAWKRGLPRPSFLYENLSPSPTLSYTITKKPKEFLCGEKNTEGSEVTEFLQWQVIFTVLNDRVTHANIWPTLPTHPRHPHYLADSFSRYLRVEGILFTLNSKPLIKYVYAWLNQNILHFKQSLKNLCLKLSTLDLIKSLEKGYRNLLQLNVLLEARFFLNFAGGFMS